MRKELDEKLCTRFPSIFRDRHGDYRETCMVWGFSCGDGWFQLIWDLCLELEKVNPQVVAQQVKEKFGGLRFYVHSSNMNGYDLITRAEALSFKVCEWCGKEGSNKESSTGWIRTLCPDCRTKEQAGYRPWLERKT